MPQTVLVTGGSGFIGTHCILQLLAAGYEVRATIRNLKREGDVRAMLKVGGAERGDQLSFFAADLASGIYVVLHLESLRDLRDRDPQFGKLIRLYPGAHGVLACTKHLYSRNSGNTCQFVRQIDVPVVCQEGTIISSLRRIDSNEHHRRVL